ncbi:hypothetical protein N7481_011813 [Penicillium waksmanii]|uniref:uncharacterized protein n=1 Tax=Penicillium waksmanii TaxID=69791 RepID=UPI0025466B9B|nr:uncharacterized protein N7481_011813 [Penicillium waksmanii]KAJ5974603.1 hypothetical protein N7481_011813 [Penicillium waksmanii]
MRNFNESIHSFKFLAQRNSIQQSHSSSPQSQPKQGFETVLIGPLIELPEALEGKVQLNGFEAAEIILT